MAYYEKLGRSQAKPWNGAIGEQQLIWLENELKAADKKQLKVIVMAHFPDVGRAGKVGLGCD